MNRIWISRASSIPVREQLSAQLLFAILSRRLAPAERLPSVRDLARRIKVHPNTVSAAYQDLAARGWVERRAGSGVFVRDVERGQKDGGLDAFVRAWIEEGASRGFSLEALRGSFEKLSGASKHAGVIVVHPDANLAQILAAEIEAGTGYAVPHSGVADASRLPGFDRALILTTTSGAAAVSSLRSPVLRPDGHRLIPLKSIDEILDGLGRPASPLLLAIVSRSEAILKWASLLVPVLGLVGSDAIQRNPALPKWRDGLAACDLIAADIISAQELPRNLRTVVLRLIPDSFLVELGKVVTAEKL
jgi:DNA-binding transcriptional regulator YhcF (GntR family)